MFFPTLSPFFFFSWLCLCFSNNTYDQYKIQRGSIATGNSSRIIASTSSEFHFLFFPFSPHKYRCNSMCVCTNIYMIYAMQYITQGTQNFIHIVIKSVLTQQDIINISINQDFFSSKWQKSSTNQTTITSSSHKRLFLPTGEKLFSSLPLKSPGVELVGFKNI